MDVAIQRAGESFIVGIPAPTIATDLTFTPWLTTSTITSKQPVHACAREAAPASAHGRWEIPWSVIIGDCDAFSADGADEWEGEEGHERPRGSD